MTEHLKKEAGRMPSITKLKRKYDHYAWKLQHACFNENSLAEVRGRMEALQEMIEDERAIRYGKKKGGR